MAGPLTGFTVLDLTVGHAGPLAAMLMADNGANVVRVTSPHGDPSMDTGGSSVRFIMPCPKKSNPIC